MDSFNSKEFEHTFTLQNVLPNQTARGDKSVRVIIDVPFTEELHGQLSHFMWKDVKIRLEKSSGTNEVESEYYIEDVIPKNFKEGPRIRMILRQPFNANIHQKLNKIIFQDINCEMVILQPELPLEEQESEEEAE